MSEITVKPIAFVRNEFQEAKGIIPREAISKIELIDSISIASFDGIDDFSHLEIIFYFHKASKVITGTAHPRNNTNIPKVGIYSHRSRNRPNHIGLTLVKLIKREGNTLTVSGLDALDGTPVLDIKPVVTRFLPQEKIKEPDWVKL
ncbi:MAG TPA: tRNA (N6-threonylcarbamoyladenosine(37)-N6)-methyltransferase TrmO [Lutibacter sp.]|nr:tRNA (N6-threonylcarbamoyladenosine(37)-N6)-methyltransferase TrmO [Lutibacter sp.]